MKPPAERVTAFIAELRADGLAWNVITDALLEGAAYAALSHGFTPRMIYHAAINAYNTVRTAASPKPGV